VNKAAVYDLADRCSGTRLQGLVRGQASIPWPSLTVIIRSRDHATEKI